MKLKTGSLIAMAFLVVGLAAGVGILQLRQLVNKPKASVSTGTIMFDVNNLDVRVVLDPQNNPIGFAKIELTFDKNVLNVTDITYNTLLKMQISVPTVSSVNSLGAIPVTLGILPADRANAPITSFDFMTIKFAKKTNTGSTSQIAFNAANSQVVDMANQQLSITSAPVTINVAGEPNNCGGTCGSHSNCKAGFFCYSGFCRNPQCPNESNCSCVTYVSNPTPVTVNYQLPTLSASPPTPYAYVAPDPSVEPVISIWTRIVRFILRLFGIKY